MIFNSASELFNKRNNQDNSIPVLLFRRKAIMKMVAFFYVCLARETSRVWEPIGITNNGRKLRLSIYLSYDKINPFTITANFHDGSGKICFTE